MNLKLVTYFLIAIFYIQIVSASPIDVTFDKSSYHPGETVQGKIIPDSTLEDEIKTTDFHLELNGTNTNVYPFLSNLDENINFKNKI